MKQVALLVLFLVWGVTTTFSAEPAPEEDYQIVEGKWFRMAKDGKGSPVRIEQELSQKMAKVKAYDRHGKLILSQQAKFRLQRTDDLNLFIYYDLEILEGPKKGAKQKKPQLCIYRLRGDRLIVVEGMASDDKLPSVVLVWWKMKMPNSTPEI